MDYDLEQVEISTIERFVDLRDQTVLEIGCGDGRISTLLASKAKAYVAIDPDRQSISRAKAGNPAVDFRIGTGEALEFADNSFQVVLFTLSLHHQNGRVALREAHRVLTENGQLVILEPATDGEFQQFFNLFDDETEALAKTLAEIQQSAFTINRQETFFIPTTFYNREELCSFHFGRRTDKTEDSALILDLLRQIQGPAAADRKIRLHDKVNIFSLSKRGNDALASGISGKPR